MILPWPTLSKRPGGAFRIFSISLETKRSPRNGHEQEFVILHTPDWVNVIAETVDHQLVMVEQYRHGSDTIELEIPGGMIDNADPSPLEAGLRELREETGYEGTEVVDLGSVFGNPAIMNNRCHTVLARNCVKRHAVDLDHGEDIATRLVPVSEVDALVNAGTFGHPLVVAALYKFRLWREARR